VPGAVHERSLSFPSFSDLVTFPACNDWEATHASVEEESERC